MQNSLNKKTDFCDTHHIAGLSAIYSPQDEPKENDGQFIRDVADTLCAMGRITAVQLSEVRSYQLKTPSKTSAEILLQLGIASQEEILIARAHIYGYEFRHIKPEMLDSSVFGKLDRNFISSNKIIPLCLEDGVLTVATCLPENVFALDEVKLRTSMDTEIIVCPENEIEAAIAAAEPKSSDYNIENLLQDIAEVEVVKETEDKSEDLEKMAGQSPVIKFVNYLISHAIRQGASDIHIEPKTIETKVRYRIDGILFEQVSPPAHMHSAIVSRLKIMSNLDISERRLPQDGKIAVVVGGRPIDLRVSILPTTHGEKVVIRILDSKSILRGLDNCGMSEQVKTAFIEQVESPNGIVLVTGPTGSGKSTTLYSALGLTDGTSLNVSTVEDPVEYELGFANQVNVNDRIGMTFSAALRSLLRQDPDIIMVGEIRDSETAKIAVQAALTGHLVLSTLHTNDAPSSVTRLVNIGVEHYLISASLNAILAQRLVRKICPHCKQAYTPPAHLLRHINSYGISTDGIYHGTGCDKCRGSGYIGRTGIYEMLVVDDAFRQIINGRCTAENLRTAFEASGAKSLYQDGMQKVADGITTIDEVIRVTDAELAKLD